MAVTKKVLPLKEVFDTSEEGQMDRIKDNIQNRRPSKWKAEFIPVLLDLSNQGYGPVELAKAIGVSESTLYRWANNNPEFISCWEMCKNLYRAWWERVGREGASGQKRGVNPYLYSFQMKVRFPEQWGDRDKDKDLGKEKAPVNIDATPEQLSNIRVALERKSA